MIKGARKGKKLRPAFDSDFMADPDDMPSEEEKRAWEKWDEELQLEKEKTFAKQFIPVFPVHVLQAIIKAEAEAALPIILAAHRWMYVLQRKATPLSSRIWDAAGYDDQAKTRNRRKTIITSLRKIPQVMKLTPRRSWIAHYWIAYGPLWKQKKRPRGRRPMAE